MKRHYWIVKWGDTIRWAESAHRELAAKYAFGMIVPEMRIADLGTRKVDAIKKERLKDFKWEVVQ